MEDEDGVEGAEFGADDAEVQSDDHGVENHAELEDQKGGDLLLEGQPGGFGVVVFDFLRESHFEVLFRAGDVRLGFSTGCVGIFFSVFDAGDGFLDVLLGSHTVFHLDVALRSKVEEENHHDGGEHDGGAPRVLGPSSRHAHAGVGSYFAVCWV